MGMATAAASRVAVMIHEALPIDVPSRRGRSGWIGMISVCISEATRPPKQSTTTLPTAPAGAFSTASDASWVSSGAEPRTWLMRETSFEVCSIHM
jgi:hypothetical protein